METNSTAYQTNDIFDDQPKTLPGTLNVLTILTFIGSGLAILGLLYSLYANMPAQYEKNKEKISEAMEKVDADSFAGKMMQGQLEAAEKAHQYHWVLFASGLIFTVMCIIGAMRMRKLRKSGFPVYTVGELAPVVITGALLGFSGFQFMIGAVLAILFVILYAAQRKHLVYP